MWKVKRREATYLLETTAKEQFLLLYVLSGFGVCCFCFLKAFANNISGVSARTDSHHDGDGQISQVKQVLYIRSNV